MPLWLQIIVIMSVFAGLGFAAFALWIGYKEREFRAGASMGELRDAVEAHKKALEAAEQRFRNLEAIVTSQEWDAGRADGYLEIPEEDPSDSERAAQAARRQRT